MKKLFLLLLAVLSVSLCASAQTRTVQGTVIDAENDEPIIGASVTVGSGYGAATDVDGKFTLKVPANTTHLKVSYIGYKTQEVKIGTGDMVIRLHSDSELLNEVIAVAYGKSTRAAFTGSAAVVGSAEIEEASVSNPLNALKGKVAGVQMTNSSGAPGADDPTILIRGISSFSAGNSPLIILDGAPYSGAMQTINPNDIENMTVLKDAAANALYGARGANGVILITTKRAKFGEAKVTLDIKIGSNSRAARDYDYIKDPAMYYEAYYLSLLNFARTSGNTLANASAWANRVMVAPDGDYTLGYNIYNVPGGQALIGLNGKLNPNATIGRVVNYNGQDYYLTNDDWMDATYKNSLRQEYNLSVSKGNENGDFLVSAGYLNNEGITPCSGFERFTARLAASTQAKSWFKASANMNYSHYDMDSYGSDEGSAGSSGNPFAFATSIAPIYPIFVRDGQGRIMQDSNGFDIYDFGNGNNAGLQRPVLNKSNALGTTLLDKDTTTGDAFNGTGTLEVRFLKDFTVTSNNTVDLLTSSGTSYTNPFYGDGVNNNGSLFKSTHKVFAFTLQQLINWNHKYGKHNVTLLAGHEFYKTTTTSLSGTKNTLFDPGNTELVGYINLISTSSGKSEYNNEGWIFRGQYDFDNRAFFSASFRRDASSRFHPKHRWGNFWSAGAAWLISSEDFMSELTWLNMLKIKASYGSQGNDNISNFLYTNQYELVNSNGVASIVPYRMGNETITWEKQGNFNAGFEFSVLDNRLSGQFEGFIRKTSDMLFYFPLPPSIGWSGYYDNIGDMVNKGIELELHGTPIKTKDWRWDIDFNFTWYKNRMTKLPEQRRTVTATTGEHGFTNASMFYYEGGSMESWYMPKFAGVDPKTGESTWFYEKPILDANGKDTGKTETTTTKTYSQATQYICGTALAPIYGGFGTSLAWKDFDLSVNFTYQIGGKAYDSTYAGLMASPTSQGRGRAIHADVFNTWSPDNTLSNLPRFQFGDSYTSGQSDRFLINASYLSLQNINLGYTIPEKIASKMYLKSLRISCSAENIFYWSKRQGFDPRLAIGGANNARYSPIRTISGALNVTF